MLSCSRVKRQHSLVDADLGVAGRALVLMGLEGRDEEGHAAQAEAPGEIAKIIRYKNISN